MTKEEIKLKEKELYDLTGQFCAKYLNDEYFELCEKLIQKLARKRDIPFKRGKVEIWAAAVIYTIGSINFLFDKSFQPYISAEKIHEYFGTKSGTVTAKAGQIKEMLKIWHFNPEFSTNHMKNNDPFNDIVSVDGLLVPISTLPAEMQELVENARREGKDIEFRTNRE